MRLNRFVCNHILYNVLDTLLCNTTTDNILKCHCEERSEAAIFPMFSKILRQAQYDKNPDLSP